MGAGSFLGSPALGFWRNLNLGFLARIKHPACCVIGQSKLCYLASDDFSECKRANDGPIWRASVSVLLGDFGSSHLMPS
jgi:hypothetical protein